MKECPELSDTYRIWPHRAEGEGHYLALLEKTDEGAEEKPAKRKNETGPAFWKDRAGRRIVEEFIADTVRDTAAAEDLMNSLILFGEQVYRLPPGMPEFSGLRVLRPGLHLGTLKKKRMEPSHALALAISPKQVRRSVDLTSDGAEIAAYLSGGTLSDGEIENGWVLVCVDGYSIGWAKAVSGILKNHYPKGLGWASE